MARIKELLEKQKAGKLTETEEKELNDLQAEAAEAANADNGDSNNGDGEEEVDEDAEVDKLAEALTSRVLSTVEKTMSKTMSKVLEATEEKKVKSGGGSPLVLVDKRFGSKTVEEAANIKVKIDGRENKKVKDLSLKSMHFVSALYQGDVNKLQVLVEGTGSRGGFLVPEDYANMIVEDLRDVTVMRQIATVMTTTSDTLHLPNLARRPQAQWRSEAAVKSTSTVDFGENVFTPYSLATIVSLSDELVSDASLGVGSSIVNYVTKVIVQSLAEKEDKAFFTGSGSGQPTGINQYSLGTQSGGITDASRADAIKQVYFRLPQGYRNRAVWVANSATLERIATLKDTQGNYLLRSLSDNPFPTLAGRPVYEQNDIAGGTLYFGDFSYYTIVDREGIQVRVSDEATVAGQSGFERNLTHVRVEKRVDGELTLTSAIRSVTSMGTP